MQNNEITSDNTTHQNLERAIIVRPEAGQIVPYGMGYRHATRQEVISFLLLLKMVYLLLERRECIPVCTITQYPIENPIQVNSCSTQYYEAEYFFLYVEHEKITKGNAPILDVVTRTIIFNASEALELRQQYYPDSLLPQNAATLNALRARIKAFNTEQARKREQQITRNAHTNTYLNERHQYFRRNFIIIDPIGIPVNRRMIPAIITMVALYFYGGILRQHRNGLSDLSWNELGDAALNVVHHTVVNTLWEIAFVCGLACAFLSVFIIYNSENPWHTVTHPFRIATSNAQQMFTPALQNIQNNVQDMIAPTLQNIQNILHLQQPATRNQRRI